MILYKINFFKSCFVGMINRHLEAININFLMMSIRLKILTKRNLPLRDSRASFQQDFADYEINIQLFSIF